MERILICFLFGIASVHSRFFVEQPEESYSALADLVRNVTQDPKVHNILLITTQFRQTEKLRIINDIVMKNTIPFRPTLTICVKNNTVPKFNSINQITGRTMAIVVHGPSNLTENHEPELRSIISIIHRKSSRTALPKMFTILISDNVSVNFNWYFSFHFDSGLLNVALVEVAECGMTVCLNVHEYNPFHLGHTSKSYEKGQYNPFPNKLKNLYGYTIRINARTTEPYLIILYKNGTRELHGVTGLFIETIEDFLNATTLLTSSTNTYQMNGLLLGLTLTASPLYTTNSIGQDQVCVCVPIMKKRLHVTIWDILPLVFTGLSVTSIFWLFLKLLRIDWDMNLNVFSLFVSMNAQTIPESLAGKLVFLCLVVTATRCSSMFYTEIFNLAVIAEEEVKIRNFEDLYNNDLNVFMTTDMYYALHHLDIPPHVRKMFRVYRHRDLMSMIMNYEEHNNSAVFVSQVACEYFVHRTQRKDKSKLLKLGEFCPLSMHLVYIFSEKSYLRNPINEIIQRMYEAGLTSRSEIYFNVREQFKFYLPPHTNDDDSLAEDRVTKYIMLGYLISILLFIVEIIQHRIRNKKLTRTENDLHSADDDFSPID